MHSASMIIEYAVVTPTLTSVRRFLIILRNIQKDAGKGNGRVGERVEFRCVK